MHKTKFIEKKPPKSTIKKNVLCLFYGLISLYLSLTKHMNNLYEYDTKMSNKSNRFIDKNSVNRYRTVLNDMLFNVTEVFSFYCFRVIVLCLLAWVIYRFFFRAHLNVEKFDKTLLFTIIPKS